MNDDPYVCPRCGADAAGNAFCGACGLHLDAVELPRRSQYSGPQPEATEASLPSSGLRESESFPLGRFIFLLVVLAIGGFGLASPDDRCAAFESAGEAAPKVIAAAIATLLWVALVATAVFLVRLIARRRRRWTLFDWWTLGLSTALVVFGSAGVAAQRSEDCGFTDVIARALM